MDDYYDGDFLLPFEGGEAVDVFETDGVVTSALVDEPTGRSKRKGRGVGNTVDDDILGMDPDECHSESKGNKKRKRDFVQGLVEKCKNLEEENVMIKAAIASMNISSSEIQAKRDERFSKLRAIVAAFNEGDINNVNSVINRNCSPKCVLVTPSIFQELNGYFAITKLFTVLLEAFPDALLNIMDLKCEDFGVVTCKFTFSGTKVFGLPTDVLFRQWRSSQTDDKKSGAVEGLGTSARGGASSADAVTLKMFDDLIAHNEALKSNAALNEKDSSTKSNPVVKVSGHMFLVFDVNEQISRMVFVWNTTSLIGQVLGHTDDNLASMSKFFSEALTQFKGNGGNGPATQVSGTSRVVTSGSQGPGSAGRRVK